MTPGSLRVLILEDRPEDAELMAAELRREGLSTECNRVETEVDFLASLTPPPEVILADYSLPQLDACRALDLLRGRGLDIPFIVVSGTITEDIAASLMRRGATDYLLKDRLGRLGAAVRNAVAECALRTQKQRAEEELQASDARFHEFMRHSPAVVFITDESGQIVYVNGADPEAADMAAQLRADASVFATGQSSQSVEQVIDSKGRQREMLCFRFLFQDASSRRLLGGISVDITQQKAAEKALSEALAAKDLLLRELHHRVKNNLQTISSLLHMQAALLPDAEARRALADAQHRVHSMALIHEQMYGAIGTPEVDFGAYAERVTRDLLESFGPIASRVRLRFELEVVALDMDQMIPCGLILNELVTNCLKYAFPGERSGEILVSLHCEDGRTVSLTVTDDGVGLPADVASKRPNSLGSRIVEMLTAQLGGSVSRRSEHGLTSTVTFTRSDRLSSNRP